MPCLKAYEIGSCLAILFQDNKSLRKEQRGHLDKISKKQKKCIEPIELRGKNVDALH